MSRIRSFQNPAQLIKRIALISLLLSSTLTVRALAQQPASSTTSTTDAAARISPLTASLFIADGTKPQGEISYWSATEIGLDQKRLPLTDIISIAFSATAKAPPRTTVNVLLANGDQLAARVVKVGEESLIADWVVAGYRQKVSIPLETVTGFTTTTVRTQTKQLRLLKLLRGAAPSEADCLFLENSDTVIGELAGFDGQAYRMRLPTSANVSSIKGLGVSGVRLNPGLISFPTIEGLRILATLTDGSRVTAQASTMAFLEAEPGKPELVQLQLTCGAEVRIPRAAVKSVAVLGGRAEYLSDLKPVAYTFRPFLSQDWPLRRDRNVLGGPLRLRGREFAKGLGTHSQSEITFALDRKYERFHTIIGIDDCASGGGQALFSVSVDGQREYHSGNVTGNAPPLEIPPIDVSAGSRLTLSVDYGAGGDVLDRGDWCQALLIRKASSKK